VVHGGGWSAGDKNRVHGHTVRLDRLSGKETLVYTKALDLTVTPKQEKTRRGSFRDMVSRAEDLQLRVSGGVLAQAMREKLVILDAKTGERLWSRDAGDELSLVHPIIANETFYVAEGRCARHSSYAHWPTERSSSYWKTVRSSP
jgi:outer membrane protein assembly factor BamB